MSASEIIAELPRLSSAERAEVEAKLRELSTTVLPAQATQISTHPSLGIWRDRTDLPEDSIEASKVLRERLVFRADRSK